MELLSMWISVAVRLGGLVIYYLIFNILIIFHHNTITWCPVVPPVVGYTDSQFIPTKLV